MKVPWPGRNRPVGVSLAFAPSEPAVCGHPNIKTLQDCLEIELHSPENHDVKQRAENRRDPTPSMLVNSEQNVRKGQRDGAALGPAHISRWVRYRQSARV